MTDDVSGSKRAARIAAAAARAGCDPAMGAALAGHVLATLPPPANAIVSGFWPLPGEIDIRPLLRALHDRGHAVVLPQTPPRGQPLLFRRWHPGAALVPGRFGTVHPDGDAMAPDWLLVPLLAFDGQCRRLGYGGGYYDRTLAGLPPGRIAVGCAFAAQRVPAVPVDDTDIVLDAVATELGITLRPTGRG